MGIRCGLAAGALLLASPALAGGIRGTARLAGAAPRPVPLQITRDQSSCGGAAPDETVVARDGKLANVVITVKGLPARAAPRALVLDQRHCRFVPHVLAGPVGSTLEIVNSDPVLHNVHGYQGQSTAFNVALPVQRQRVTRKLDRPGAVKVRCDVHGWMSAWVVVAEGPSGVSGADGTFAIPDVPPGTWSVTAWHEKLGERSAQVTVPASGEAAVDFSFGG
jgi:plastocyanin